MQASNTVIKTSLNRTRVTSSASLMSDKGNQQGKNKKRKHDRSGRDAKRNYDFE